MCEEGITVVCTLKQKHVEKDDSCDVFEEESNNG